MIERETRDHRWAQSLADGPAGTVLLYREQGVRRPDGLGAMLAAPALAHPHQATLFEGAPGLAFVLAALEPTRALATLDGHVETITRTRLDAAHRRIDHGALATKGEYDLMAGLTGLGVYVLRRHGECPLLRDVLAYLVRLTESHPDELPGWWSRHGPTRSDPAWDGGHGNLGISHGIAGPLALLAQTARRDIRVAGQAHAMYRILSWLDLWVRAGEHGVWWPGFVTRDEHDTGAIHQEGPQRPSWCYGTPGIARAQQLAGLALGDTQRQRFAEDSLCGCLADDHQLEQLTTVGLCHGWAGLLHTAWRMGEHDARLRTHLPTMIDRLKTRLHEQPSEEPGLLTGQAGARLALHTATSNTPPITQWDACLLLGE